MQALECNVHSLNFGVVAEMLEGAFIPQFWLVVAKDGVNFLVSQDRSCWCTLSSQIILKHQVLITTWQYFACGGMLLKHVNASNCQIKGRWFTWKTDNSRHCSTMETARGGGSITLLLLLWVESPRQGQEIEHICFKFETTSSILGTCSYMIWSI